MKITFLQARDLGEHGTASAGESRADLPAEYAALQVRYGVAREEPPAAEGPTAPANPKPKTQNPKLQK